MKGYAKFPRPMRDAIDCAAIAARANACEWDDPSRDLGMLLFRLEAHDFVVDGSETYAKVIARLDRADGLMRPACEMLSAVAEVARYLEALAEVFRIWRDEKRDHSR